MTELEIPTIIVIGLTRAIELAFHDIVSWEKLKDDGVALNSADGLWNEDESCRSDLYGVYSGRNECRETREDRAMHFDLAFNWIKNNESTLQKDFVVQIATLGKIE